MEADPMKPFARLLPFLWLIGIAGVLAISAAGSFAGRGDPPPRPSADQPRMTPGDGPAAVNVTADAASPPAEAVLVARGKALFARQCVICHGEQGDGAGVFAYLMNPRPRNFQKGKFKLTTTQNQVPSEDDLLRTISRGMPGSAMPPWGHLPLADLKALVAYVRKVHVDAVRAELEQGISDGTFKEV